LTHLRFDPAPDPHYIVGLDRTNTRTIDRTGGTWLHTSRTNPKKMKADNIPAFLDRARVAAMTNEDGVVDLTPVVLENIERLGLDVLVTIGGDDTLSFSRVLFDEGVPLVAIPKTMDNDVAGTEYCIGFSTAITRAKELINRQRTTLGSHERIGVFRIFGRDAGFTALFTAYVTSGRCLIPEAPYDLRSGEPDSVDQIVATTFANVAMDLVADGVTGRLVGIRDGRYAHTDLPEPGRPRTVDVETMYNGERFRPRYEGRLGDPMLLVGLGGGVAAGV
jgi:6-phosphofructokinase